MRTAAQRLANKLRSRKWRALNPERARAIAVKSREKHPMTPERRALKVEQARAWRAKNAAHAKRVAAKRWLEKRDEVNARRRATRDAAKERARMAAWNAAHPERHRTFYRRHREKFIGNGQWSSRTKRLKSAWRKFTHTCAANRSRLSTQEQSQ